MWQPVCAVLASLALAGCATIDKLPTQPVGTLSGKTTLVWNSEDGFIYVPDPSDPLTYTRPGKPPVQPGLIYTDGGSVPRIFWAVKGFSPWAYGPAYVLHDFLYNEHRCGRLAPPPTGYGFDDANAVLSDAILIIVKDHKADGGSRGLVMAAVDSFGKGAWNDKCVPTPPQPLTAARRQRSMTIATFSF